MFNREDFSHIPTEYEMKEYINNDLWEDFCKYMKNKYNINPKSWVVVISLADSTRSVYSSAYLFSSSVGVFSYKYHNTPGKKPEIHAR